MMFDFSRNSRIALSVMDARRWVLKATVLALAANIAHAVPPADIESALVKIGPIVDPVCTARLYRPLMPKNDITSNVPQLYPGITISRNKSFGADPKDVVDIFSAKTGPAKRTVLVYVPGGAGNKIEIQDRPRTRFTTTLAALRPNTVWSAY